MVLRVSAWLVKWFTDEFHLCLSTTDVNAYYDSRKSFGETINKQEVISRQCETWRFAIAEIRYDTRSILTCARKPTWIGLIYRTETTTKNCKTEKLKSKSRYVRSNSKSLGNHVVSSEKKKKKGCSGKDLQKKVLSLEWKREWVMKN